MSARGMSLAESMAALALLGIAVLLASGAIVRRHAVESGLEARSTAMRLVSSRLDEALAGNRVPSSLAFVAEELPQGRGRVSIEPWGKGILLVRAEIEWRGGRLVRETLTEAAR